MTMNKHPFIFACKNCKSLFTDSESIDQVKMGPESYYIKTNCPQSPDSQPNKKRVSWADKSQNFIEFKVDPSIKPQSQANPKHK